MQEPTPDQLTRAAQRDVPVAVIMAEDEQTERTLEAMGRGYFVHTTGRTAKDWNTLSAIRRMAFRHQAAELFHVLTNARFEAARG